MLEHFFGFLQTLTLKGDTASLPGNCKALISKLLKHQNVCILEQQSHI